MQKEVSHLLLNYLASHATLALAGIGRFTREYRSAHFVGNQLKAPGSIYYFDADRSLKENSPVIVHAIQAYKWDETAVSQALIHVFEEVNKELGQQNRFSYPGFGTFERSGAKVEFKPDNQQFMDSYAFGLESVLVQAKRTEIPADTKVKEMPKVSFNSKSGNFWLKVAAAVLFLLVANFAVLYFLEQQEQLTDWNQQAEIGSFDSVQWPVVEPNGVNADKMQATLTEDSLKAESNNVAIQEQPDPDNVAPGSSQFTVIVGAFRELSNAEKYIQDLKNKGYTDAAQAGTTNSGLHRVSVAKFSSQEMAEAYLEEIKRKLQADAWLMN